MEDNVAVVVLQEWDLTSVYFDGKVAKGPVPIFFAEDKGAAQEAMEDADIESALREHKKLMRR